MSSGLAQSTEEALDQALDTLRHRMPKPANEAESTTTITHAWPLLASATAVARRIDDEGSSPREQAVSRFVLDGSIVLTWCFPDDESQKAQEVAERIAGGDRLLVPAGAMRC